MPLLVAFRSCSPAASGPTFARPSAPVSCPPTLAPVTGALVRASVTRTVTASPGRAVAGPPNTSSGSVPTPYAKRTLSPFWIGSAQAPTDANAPFLYSARKRPVAASKATDSPATVEKLGPKASNHVPVIASRRGDDRCAACRAGLGAGAAGRGPVALMGRRVAGELERTDVGRDGTLEQRPRGSLDPEVDRDGRGRGGSREQRCADEAGGEAGGSSELHRWSHPFPRGLIGLGRREVSWLPGPTLRRLPGSRCDASGCGPGAACGGLPR